MKKFLVFSLAFGFATPLVLLAQNDGRSTTTSNTTAPMTVTYNATCASSAVIANENSQESIVEAQQASMKIAVTTRRDALGSAYLLTDKTVRETAIKAAMNDFMTAQKAVNKVAMDASKTENTSFNTIMKACGARLTPIIKIQNDDQDSLENNGENKMMGSGDQTKPKQGGMMNGNKVPRIMKNNSDLKQGVGQGEKGAQGDGQNQQGQGSEGGQRPMDVQGQNPPPPQRGLFQRMFGF